MAEPVQSGVVFASIEYCINASSMCEEVCDPEAAAEYFAQREVAGYTLQAAMAPGMHPTEVVVKSSVECAGPQRKFLRGMRCGLRAEVTLDAVWPKDE